MDQDLDPLLEAIRAAAETRSTEYKSGQPFSVLRWKILRTCMAMANLRDGGRIIIGMAERDGRWFPDGVDSAIAGEYTQDGLLAFVNRYARPLVELTLQHLTDNGRAFIAIAIAEFDRSFVFCGTPTPSEAGSDGLRVGDIPARTRDRISTTRVHDVRLVEEIIEIAAEKRAAEIIATAQRIGLRLPDDAAETMRNQRIQFSQDFE